VRGAAVWSLSQLLPAGEFEGLARTRAGHESEASVCEEWSAASAAPDHSAA
jgi:hypothetical protein